MIFNVVCCKEDLGIELVSGGMYVFLLVICLDMNSVGIWLIHGQENFIYLLVKNRARENNGQLSDLRYKDKYEIKE